MRIKIYTDAGMRFDAMNKSNVMKEQDKNKENEQAKRSLNVLHREPGAPTAGGPDREQARGEESPEGKLRGVADPSPDKRKPEAGGALSGLNEGDTWENDRINKANASRGASPDEQRDQQTR